MKRVITLVFICGAASCVATTAVPATRAQAAPATKATARAKAHAAPKLTAKELAARAEAKEAARIAAMKRLAPGDEYFGPLKQSIIGISNTIRDLGLRYDVNHDIGKQTFASAELTEKSIRDWDKKYPHDTQLPRAIYFLQRLYTKVLIKPSRDRAHVIAQWLASTFAKSPQAKQLAKTLAVEHLAPLPAETPAPTPSPSGPTYGSEFGPAYPSEFVSPTSAASPSPTPLPTTTRRP